jgi:hypothetical protein
MPHGEKQAAAWIGTDGLHEHKKNIKDHHPELPSPWIPE